MTKAFSLPRFLMGSSSAANKVGEYQWRKSRKHGGWRERIASRADIISVLIPPVAQREAGDIVHLRPEGCHRIEVLGCHRMDSDGCHTDGRRGYHEDTFSPEHRHVTSRDTAPWLS